MKRHRAVVIGLGQVGSRFDEEPGRSIVWTHAGAYLSLPNVYDLVGVCDTDPRNADNFSRRHKGIPVFAAVGELLAATRPEVVSICTPTHTHARLAAEAMTTSSVRALWCEKPIADNILDAERTVAQAESHGIFLVISHVRRWTPLWQEAAQRLKAGEVGRIRSVRIAMPNRLLSIGSHAIDLALMLGGVPVAHSALAIPDLNEGGEKAVAAAIRFESGAYALIQVTGPKENLCVEGEVIGDDGRMTVRESSGEIIMERFAPSPRYAGYRELIADRTIRADGFTNSSPFVNIAHEIAGLLSKAISTPTCSGKEALAVQKLLAALGEVTP